MQPAPRHRQNGCEPEETATSSNGNRSGDFECKHANQEGGRDEQSEHDEWIEKETCVAPVGQQVTPKSAGQNEIQKRKNADGNARANASTPAALNSVAPSDQTVIGFD